jgi:predicted RNase H-like HicB family nuclease
MEDYRVEVELGQSGRWWVFSVPDVPGAHSQARRLSQVEEVARELISLMTDAKPDSFSVHIHVTLPDAVRRDLEQSAALRAEAARAQSEAARLSRHAACLLHDRGLPLRDVGQALGVSFQRAKQLVDEAEKVAC